MQADDEKLAALEREMDLATDRLWQAKLALKQAKVLVKVARKARKQLRKEHARLQDELSGTESPAPTEESTPGKRSGDTLKVADSPEKAKVHRKKVKLLPPEQGKEVVVEPSVSSPDVVIHDPS